MALQLFEADETEEQINLQYEPKIHEMAKLERNYEDPQSIEDLKQELWDDGYDFRENGRKEDAYLLRVTDGSTVAALMVDDTGEDLDYHFASDSLEDRRRELLNI